MIDIINTKYITKDERLQTLKRSLLSTPFYSRLDFDLTGNETANNPNINQREKKRVNVDYYLTEIIGNFGEKSYAHAGDRFNLSVWTMYGESVYRFDKSQDLPSGFIATEARFQTPIASELFDDRQREFFPRLIKYGDSILGQIQLTSGFSGDVYTVTTVLKGFNMIPNGYIDPDTIAACNASLDRPARYEYFKLSIDDDGQVIKLIENDMFPRVVLGFGCTNYSADKAAVSTATVRIKDITRRIAFMEEAIPLDFIAPRLTCLADAHIYYLPTEYYLKPYGKLEFDFGVTAAGGGFHGFEINVLTRTV